MPNLRFTISADPEIHAAIKAHADAAGIDVSAYMVAAAAAQIAADDAAVAVFASLDAENAAGEEPAGAPRPELPPFEDLSPDERAQIRRVVGSALGSRDADVA